MHVAGSIGRFVETATGIGLDAATTHHTTRALIDWTGATIAGWRTESVDRLLSALGEEVGHGAAQVLHSAGMRAPARTAALLNGTASHTVELDDIYSPGLYHPGSPTIAAALAAADLANGDGRSLLTAIAIGYQVGNCIARAVQPSHYHFWHTTGTVGCFGAAAAAASALRLSAEQTAHALATSATFTAGLQQAFRSDSMSKPLHAGRAAEAGVFAAMCARAGFTGEARMFEGEVGFGAAMSRDVDWADAMATLESPWTIGESTYKLHACCGHAFSPIDGALALRDRIGDVAAIRRIRIETYSTAIAVAGIADPISPFEAKFSIPFTVATALVTGSVLPDAFTAAGLADPRVKAILPLFELASGDAHDRVYPAMRSAAIAIELNDGSILHHDQPTRRGSPTYPLDDAGLHRKFVDLARPTLGRAGAEDVLEDLRITDRATTSFLDLRAS